MSDENNLINYLNTLGFKDNPNDYNIVAKWNRKLYDQYKYDIFNEINKYIDEHIAEFVQPIPQHLGFTNLIAYGDKNGCTIIDEDEHIWYNKFNKWSWSKFENGVIKYESGNRL